MTEANILALETTTEVCSICLIKDGKVLSKREKTGYVHSSLAAVFVKECLNESGLTVKDLDAVAVSIGPGSYTGLRVGLATAKGICYMHDLPLIAVSTLEGFAYQSMNRHPKENAVYLPMIDARRMEVYVAAFDHNRNEILAAQPLILKPGWFDRWAKFDHIILSGNGSPKVKKLEKLPSNLHFSIVSADAENIAKIGLVKYERKEFADLAYTEPEYIKPPNVTRPKKSPLQ